MDAEYLARIGRLDPALLFPLKHRTAETQVDLALLRSRAMIIKARGTLIHHVRGVVKSAGGRIPLCDARGFARRAVLHLPPELEPVLAPVVATIASLDETKAEALDNLGERDAGIRLVEEWMRSEEAQLRS